MSAFLLRAWAVLVIAAKRLVAQRGLALATALGLVAAASLTLSVPLYADAVYYRVFRAKVSDPSAESDGASQRPPFAFLFSYIGAWHGPKEWEEVRAADEYLSGPGGAGLGLPIKLAVRHFRTDTFRMFPENDLAYADVRDPLAWVRFASMSNFEQHATLLEGRFPAPADSSAESPVEVLVTQPFAQELGLQVAETYVAFQHITEADAERVVQIPIRIAGVWEATDPNEEYWCCPVSAFTQLMFVPEATFRDRLAPHLTGEVHLAEWYIVADGSDVHAADAGPLTARILSVWQRSEALLPNMRLDVSPLERLQQYRRAAALLTVLLYAFSLPILALILAFIGLAVGLSVERQRAEIAVLRSRGATTAQVVGIAALEALLLGALGLALGWPAGEGLAALIGKTRSFLNFSAPPPGGLRVDMTVATLRFGLLAVGLALLAQVVPTIGAARHTVLTYKQERARSIRAPWWQRAYLDLLLLIPAAYGAYLLRGQGSIAPPAQRGGVSSGGALTDPFQNPLLFLVPALGSFALTLFILRLAPPLMAGIARAAGRTRSVDLLLAARHLARTPRFYNPPLVLLTLTLSLSVFTASLAKTLEDHLRDQTLYRIGADMSLVEPGESPPGAQGNSPFPSLNAGSSGDEEGPAWFFLPVSEHLKIPGVRAAARVGSYAASTELAGRTQAGRFLGIDRTDFPQVAFWRRDFAPESLGGLMNRLALESNGVLVPRGYLAGGALSIGDTIRVRVTAYGQTVAQDMRIVGTFGLFPSWYPEGGPLFGAEGPLWVGNLDSFFEAAGGEFPYDVWLKTDPGADPSRIADGVQALGIQVLDWDAASADILAEQRRPERQGLFGLLSVGFVASALLTVLGFLLYALFSFQRRFIEMGVLRAVGLSSRQMAGFLAWELAFLIATGLAAGTGIGGWMSRLFIPHLQVGADAASRVPPFVVAIAWPAILQIYALFALLFFTALLALATLLRRMRIFEAVKLGETA